MKNITKILILFSIPDQLFIIIGLVFYGAPFCYYGLTPAPPGHIAPSDYIIPSIAVFQCHWGIDDFLQSYLVYPLIITLPMMLTAFLIYCVKNKRKNE